MDGLSELLLAVLRSGTVVAPERLAVLTATDWRALLALAARQRVRPLFWQRLKEKGLRDGLPPAVADALAAAARRQALYNLRAYGELRTLLARLAEERIPVILLKGVHLAATVYPDRGGREMSDIDLLARPGDLRRIAEHLQALGYGSSKPLAAEITLQVNHHLPPLIKAGQAVFEIHWNLMGPEEWGYVPPEGFWERATAVDIDGNAALALSAEDLLLHLCHHATYHHRCEFGLRPCCDIAAVIDHFGPALAWGRLVERAAEFGWQRGVYLALHLARELLGAAVPEAVLGQLRPAEPPPALLATARAQLFSDYGLAPAVSLPVAELLRSTSWRARWRIFWQRVFVSRASLALSYAVPPTSWRIYICYPRRVWDLLRRHHHRLRDYRDEDHGLRTVVERTSAIAAWLAPAP